MVNVIISNRPVTIDRSAEPILYCRKFKILSVLFKPSVEVYIDIIL